MKILHISTPLSWRGGEQQVAFLADELRPRGIDQLVLCPEGSEMEEWCRLQKIPYITFRKKGSFDVGLALKIRQVCKSENIKLIHAHDSHAHTAAILSALVFGNKVPVVLSRRVDFAISRTFFSRYKYNHPVVKKIVCVSSAVKKIMMADIRNQAVLDVIYDGIDPNRFNRGSRGTLRKEYKLSSDTLIIGNVAALAEHKDYFTFVDTVEILVNRNLNAKYFIIGKGELKEQIENYIAKKKLEQHIILTGFVNDITEILPELDILLFTSETEGLGSTILDAFAAGVSVVATSAGGIPEIVIHETTGLLAPVKDAKALAENVIRLASDKKLQEHLKESAKMSLNRFTKQSMASAWIKIYEANSSSE